MLSWLPVRGAEGYEVRRVWNGRSTIVGNTTNAYFSGLRPNTKYVLHVRAYNAAGNSTWSGGWFQTLK